MGLLGKTLKGRSARPGGLPPKKNIKIRQIAKTQEEFDQLKKLAKMKKDILRSKMESEHKMVNFNKKKLLTYWRKIMRIAKTEELRGEIDVYSQNNQRELDSKEAFIQMLDKNLDEANNQHQIALRNHLIHIDSLFSLQGSRLHGLMQEFGRDVALLEQEYLSERDEMEHTHYDHLKELNDMIDTVKEEDRRKAEEAKTEEQAFREEIKNKNLEELQHMKFNLEAKQTKHYTELEQMHQKYSSDTGKKTEEHSKNFEDNKNMTIKIDELARNIARKRSKIDLLKLKILQHKKESGGRNNALKKEKDNISKNYQELKEKMNRFRDEEDRRLKELANNSRNSVETLKQYLDLGERILKTAELCRRQETEKEKVLPYYEDTVDQSEISQEMRNQFQELTAEEYEEFKYLNNFFKRHNKVLLDRLAIQKQKETLSKDNQMLKSLLKQYLDGISLNDEVLRTNNPLFIINNRIQIAQEPVEETHAPTIIDANFVQNYNLHQLGRMAPQRFQ
jgi:hypothetical protein